MKQCSRLHDALDAGDADRLVALLRDGAAIDEQNGHGGTPLMAASISGKLDLAQLLLDYGAELDAVDAEGKSALHWASYLRGPDAVCFLVRLGADVNKVDTFGGFTPLHREEGNSPGTSLPVQGTDRSQSGEARSGFHFAGCRRKNGAGYCHRDRNYRTGGQCGGSRSASQPLIMKSFRASLIKQLMLALKRSIAGCRELAPNGSMRHSPPESWLS